MTASLKNLARNKTRMALFFLLVLGSTLVATSLLPKVYRVTAQVEILLPLPKYTFDSATLSRRPCPRPTAQARRSWLYRQLDHLKDPALLRQALASLPGEKTVRFAKDLQVRLLEGTSRVTLSLETRHPKAGAQFLQNLLAQFQKDLRASLPSAQKAKDLQEAAHSANQELARLQAALKDLKNRTHLTLLQRRLPALRREIGSFQNDLDQKRARLAALQKEIQDLQETLPRLPKMIPARAGRKGPPPDQDPLSLRLQALQKKEIELLAKYPKDSQPVRNLRKEIQALTQAILKRDSSPRKKVLNPARVRLQQELAGKKSALQALQAQLEVLKKRLAKRRKEAQETQGALQDATLKAADLEARIQQARKKFYALSDLASQAALQEKALALRPVLKTIRPPLPPLVPVKPDPKTNLLTALALATLGALAIGLLAPPPKKT